jgi:Calpain family cysteine protease
LNDTKDNDTIDQIELTDLQKILTNAGMFNTPDYVKVLTNKVVNGDTANAHYQKTDLGNLSAGSSASHMDKLINKWFLGLDRPDTTDVDGVTYTYKFVSGGSLFQNGVSYQDIYQGYVGDCYFLSALASTALRSPSTIESMFTDNGDNTYTVRFYNNGVADYVTIDRYLPVDGYGTFIYARQKAASWGAPGDAANEWWYALAEKAYAQLNESGWTGQDGTNSYSGIIAGWEGNTIKQVTGLNTTVGGSMNFDNIVTAFNSGKWITIGSKFSGVASNVVVGHAYVLVGYNSTTQKFTLFNPWGVGADASKPGLLDLSWTEILASFSDWTRTV